MEDQKTAFVSLGKHTINVFMWSVTPGGGDLTVPEWPVTPTEIERRAAEKLASFGMDPATAERADAVWALTVGVGEIKGARVAPHESTMTIEERRESAEAG